MNPQKKVYLGHLSNAEILSDLTEDNPAYLCFICYLGSQGWFPLYSQINNLEIDCRQLMRRYRLTNFIPRSKRVGHFVTHKDCKLNSRGEKLFEELRKNEVCDIIKEFLEAYDNITRIKFNNFFRNKFSFEIDPQNKLQEKIKEVINKYNTNFPNERISYKNMNIKPILKEGSLYYRFKIACYCSNKINEDINMENYKGGFQMKCDKCDHPYHIVYNFSSYW